uniref:Uncharacterized protein n=1 Tax=Rhizophora mucronata TaxID=61149 RepID=A0A2P2IPT7_RHIMU
MDGRLFSPVSILQGSGVRRGYARESAVSQSVGVSELTDFSRGLQFHKPLHWKKV